MNASGLVLSTLGAVVMLIAAIGVVRLPDALSRQHAATKAGTLGLAVFAAGVALAVPAWAGRMAALIALLLATLPLASHALARATARGLEPPVEQPVDPGTA